MPPLSETDSSIGREFLSFLYPSITTNDSFGYHRAVALATLAALRTAAARGFALTVAFASRSIILLLAIWLIVETGVRIVIVLSYGAWVLILTISATAAAFT